MEEKILIQNKMEQEKRKLTKLTENHYVVVDDSEIKEGDWCLYKNKFGGQFICQAYMYESTLIFDDGSFNRILGEGITPQKNECKKITHSTHPLEDGTTIHGIEHKRWVHIKYIDLSESIEEFKKQ